MKSLQDTSTIHYDLYKHKRWKVVPKKFLQKLIEVTYYRGQFVMFSDNFKTSFL